MAKTTVAAIFGLLLALSVLVAACTSEQAATYWNGPTTWEPEDISGLVSITQELVPPPALPRHTQTYQGRPRVVKVRMEVEEKEIEVAPGVFMWAFTFNGSVPGPIIVVHEGDYVELTLVNPTTSKLVHNIDFHASIGALGGGGLTLVAPGQQTVLEVPRHKAGRVHLSLRPRREHGSLARYPRDERSRYGAASRRAERPRWQPRHL